LEAITNDNALRLFANQRLSDVILKGGTYLPPRTFEFYSRSHVDFVVTDENSKPILAVEYDGPSHSEPRQQERDRIKDELCASACLGILRSMPVVLAIPPCQLKQYAALMQIRNLHPVGRRSTLTQSRTCGHSS
jgi:hypothetical protein